mgnify:CR=1 FL=1
MYSIIISSSFKKKYLTFTVADAIANQLDYNKTLKLQTETNLNLTPVNFERAYDYKVFQFTNIIYSAKEGSNETIATNYEYTYYTNWGGVRNAGGDHEVQGDGAEVIQRLAVHIFVPLKQLEQLAHKEAGNHDWNRDDDALQCGNLGDQIVEDEADEDDDARDGPRQGHGVGGVVVGHIIGGGDALSLGDAAGPILLGHAAYAAGLVQSTAAARNVDEQHADDRAGDDADSSIGVADGVCGFHREVRLLTHNARHHGAHAGAAEERGEGQKTVGVVGTGHHAAHEEDADDDLR